MTRDEMAWATHEARLKIAQEIREGKWDDKDISGVLARLLIGSVDLDHETRARLASGRKD